MFDFLKYIRQLFRFKKPKVQCEKLILYLLDETNHIMHKLKQKPISQLNLHNIMIESGVFNKINNMYILQKSKILKALSKLQEITREEALIISEKTNAEYIVITESYIYPVSKNIYILYIWPIDSECKVIDIIIFRTRTFGFLARTWSDSAL